MSHENRYVVVENDSLTANLQKTTHEKRERTETCTQKVMFTFLNNCRNVLRAQHLDSIFEYFIL